MSQTPPPTIEQPRASAGRGGAHRLLAMAVVVESGLLLAAWLLGRLLGAPAFAAMGPGARGVLWGLAAVLPGLALLPWSLRTSWPPMARTRALLYEAVLPLVARAGAFQLLLISLLAGVAEEALFRGVLQTAAAGRLGAAPGLALASLLFGLAHPLSPLYVLLAALLGAWWGALLLATGDLLAPVTAHAVHDLVALLVLRSMARRGAAGPASPPGIVVR